MTFTGLKPRTVAAATVAASLCAAGTLSLTVGHGTEQPIVFWVPSIAVTGMTFYTGDRFPAWKRNVFGGGLRQGEVPRTGQINRIVFNEKWEEIRREPMLMSLGQRIRDVRQGPDGLLYIITAENPGALMRLEPGDTNTTGSLR
jgi:glucose/arabinose dehydrogenase